MEASILVLPMHLQWTKACLCCMHDHLSSTHQGLCLLHEAHLGLKGASLASPDAEAADLRNGTCCKQAVLAVVPS